MSPNEQTARLLLSLLSHGGDRTRLPEVFHPDVEQVEYPNRLVPTGARRDAAALLQASAKGQQVVTDEHYEVRSVVEKGDALAMEVGWRARLNVQVGQTPAGGTLEADFAIFLTFHEGRIRTQHNYDCFHPF
jgi:ketosteroid isomerase-like protein